MHNKHITLDEFMTRYRKITNTQHHATHGAMNRFRLAYAGGIIDDPQHFPERQAELDWLNTLDRWERTQVEFGVMA